MPSIKSSSIIFFRISPSPLDCVESAPLARTSPISRSVQDGKSYAESMHSWHYQQVEFHISIVHHPTIFPDSMDDN